MPAPKLTCATFAYALGPTVAAIKLPRLYGYPMSYCKTGVTLKPDFVFNVPPARNENGETYPAR